MYAIRKEAKMADLTVATFDEMEPMFGGLARRARATLGVTCVGMQVYTLPPSWDGYPEHNHDANAVDPNQEEVYIPVEGSATLIADGDRVELQPGMMARVGATQRRRILPGPDGVRFIALGGIPGAFEPSPWWELGGPMPPSAD
jgi:uncharacterized cupin superfamily protein